MVEDAAALDTRNWEEQRVPVGGKLTVRWLEMDEVESPKDDLRHRGYAKGAARFARGEGMWYAEGSIYFACTNGGAKKAGQVWKLTGDTLELFAEPNDKDLCDNCDNLTALENRIINSSLFVPGPLHLLTLIAMALDVLSLLHINDVRWLYLPAGLTTLYWVALVTINARKNRYLHTD